MFGIGFGEAAVIAVIAVLVFGPEKMPELARQIARVIKRVKTLATGARDDLRTELGPEFADLDLRDLDPRKLIAKQIREALDEVEAEEAAAKAPKPLLADELPPYDVEAT